MKVPCQTFPVIHTTTHFRSFGVINPVIVNILFDLAGITVDTRAGINGPDWFSCVEIVIVGSRSESLGDEKVLPAYKYPENECNELVMVKPLEESCQDFGVFDLNHSCPSRSSCFFINVSMLLISFFIRCNSGHFGEHLCAWAYHARTSLAIISSILEVCFFAIQNTNTLRDLPLLDLVNMDF